MAFITRGIEIYRVDSAVKSKPCTTMQVHIMDNGVIYSSFDTTWMRKSHSHTALESCIDPVECQCWQGHWNGAGPAAEVWVFMAWRMLQLILQWCFYLQNQEKHLGIGEHHHGSSGNTCPRYCPARQSTWSRSAASTINKPNSWSTIHASCRGKHEASQRKVSTEKTSTCWRLPERLQLQFWMYLMLSWLSVSQCIHQLIYSYKTSKHDLPGNCNNVTYISA